LNFAKAEEILRLAVENKRKSGWNEPDSATMFCNLGSVLVARGRAAEAVAEFLRCQEIRESNMAMMLSSGSEIQQQQYLAESLEEVYDTVSLHTLAIPQNADALRLALTTVLRRKGRALDAEAGDAVALRRRLSAADRALFDELIQVRGRKASQALTRLATRAPKPAPGRAALMESDDGLMLMRTFESWEDAEASTLDANEDRLKRLLSAHAEAFRIREEPVTVEAVQATLPEGSALIEYFGYGAMDFARSQYTGMRYVAYVLPKSGALFHIDLGDKEALDALAVHLHSSLRNPGSELYREDGRALYQKLLSPVLARLPGVEQLFISPDGQLNLIPFGALPDEGGGYLVKSKKITYLSSGRELLRLTNLVRPQSAPIIFSAPSYGAKVADQEERSTPICPGFEFNSLDVQQGQNVRELLGLPSARLIEGPQATETALKRIQGPGILHLVTHGYFCPDAPAKTPVRGEGPKADRGDALVRSGLILANANQRKKGQADDGVLTALEVSALDLWGTQLVVLSACETGVGDVHDGEGVFGLRRALAVAGAASQVLTLWKVDEAATRDLMIEFYQRLRAGESRAEALRQAQLKMADRHPYYWAAFIQSGDSRALPAEARGAAR
jgi:CHAT domain-containing protein